ncbi:MAG: ThuA domain-containing protein [Chloroflexi bacterium]|nr:ThuA domain-containing protein [Chloroflexota bacterium]
MNLLVISGGRHPYEETTPALEEFLKAAGHDLTVTEDASVLADSAKMNTYDALVFNTLRAGDNGLSRDEQAGMTSFIEAGKGFVCIHISGCASEDWPQYYDITGGGWVMGQSFHPPFGNFSVDIKDKNHQGVNGVSGFTTDDELYMAIEYKDGNDVFITSDFVEGTYPRNNPQGEPIHMPGGTFPLGWTRMSGSGRVFVTLLGHNGLSFETPEFQKIVLNGVDWVTGKA